MFTAFDSNYISTEITFFHSMRHFVKAAPFFGAKVSCSLSRGQVSLPHPNTRLTDFYQQHRFSTTTWDMLAQFLPTAKLSTLQVQLCHSFCLILKM